MFNLFNTYNWGLPNRNFSARMFGRTTTMIDDLRIVQFDIKYGF